MLTFFFLYLFFEFKFFNHFDCSHGLVKIFLLVASCLFRNGGIINRIFLFISELYFSIHSINKLILEKSSALLVRVIPLFTSNISNIIILLQYTIKYFFPFIFIFPIYIFILIHAYIIDQPVFTTKQFFGIFSFVEHFFPTRSHTKCFFEHFEFTILHVLHFSHYIQLSI